MYYHYMTIGDNLEVSHTPMTKDGHVTVVKQLQYFFCCVCTDSDTEKRIAYWKCLCATCSNSLC